MRRRPCGSSATSPASRSTLRCSATAGRLSSNWSLSSPADSCCRVRISNSSRRTGFARARKTRSEVATLALYVGNFRHVNYLGGRRQATFLCMRFAWEQLTPSVHRCRLPFCDVTVGLVCGRTGALLVDTGTTLTEAAAIDDDVQQLAGS